MTARQLLDALTAAGCVPSIEGEELVLDTIPPAPLEPFVELLSTGMRALLTGRRWFGLDAQTGRGCGPLRDGALDPAQLLPSNVSLLCVEGDRIWDRHPLAVVLTPSAFEPPATKKQKNGRTAAV
ncbi:hypothetical protein [Fimbriiglobus ruber]|uniref:Uncharacterized protein n=1 Tax=Fimbriiglobus ruber TaxID=1908690 RepID=A0A225D3K3_9BACT|nr:hypothetical protein [Fimbriiglobus ruber]OWK34184.1 hypothetical protein FRUB_10155 [Fimbriiglobus ruber]